MKLKNNYYVKNVAGTPNRPTTRTYKTSCKSFVLALLFMVKYLLSHGDSKWLGIDIRNEVCTFVIPISSGKNQNIQKLILSRIMCIDICNYYIFILMSKYTFRLRHVIQPITTIGTPLMTCMATIL